MKIKLLTCLLLFLNLSKFNLNATTYYISLSGKNSNSGTSPGSAWQSIDKVNTKNFKGDTILFQGGSVFVGNLQFTASDVGTSSKPIVIGSYGTGKATISSNLLYGISIYNAAGFKIKDLIFKGSGRTTNLESGVKIYLDKDLTVLSYLKIDNVEATGYHGSGVSIGSWNKKSGFTDISVTNSLLHDNGTSGLAMFAESLYVHKNIYIGHNKTYNNSGIDTQSVGSTGSGIVLGHVDGATIENCTSYNNGWLHSNTYGGPIGIWAYGSKNVTIQFNESHHNKTGNTKDGGGFDLDGCSYSTMQYNYSHDNYGSGFLLARYASSPVMTNLTVRYNITENDGRKNGYAGIHLWSSGTITGIKTVQIYNNDVYTTPVTNGVPKAFFVRSGVFSGMSVRNNIFQTTAGVPVVSVSSTSGFTFQGNDYWSSGSTFSVKWGSSSYSSLLAWRTATGQEKINGTTSGYQLDPQFNDVATGTTFPDATQITQLQRYKLKSTSGLIDKGLNLTSLFSTNTGSRDFWGNSIVNKTKFNIGAYQITSSGKSIVSPAEAYPITKATLEVFPNPVSSNATVMFTMQKAGKASVVVYNADGKTLTTLFSGELKAGEIKKIMLDAGGLRNGLFFVQLTGNEESLTKKIVVSK